MLSSVATIPRMKFAQRLDGPFTAIVTNASQNGISHQTVANSHPPASIVAPHASIFFIETGSMVTMIICAENASAEMNHSTTILVFHFRVSMVFFLRMKMVSTGGHCQRQAV